MGTTLSPHIKSQIIGDWLSGKRRREISMNCGISTGAISNIVEEWRLHIGRSELDSLRELGLEWRKSGITATECALGMRVVNILRLLSIKEDQIYLFIKQLYDRCQYYGISPDIIVSTARQIVGLVSDVPVPEIPKYVREKVHEKIRIDYETQESVKEKNSAVVQLDRTLKNNAVTTQTLTIFAKARADLKSNFHINIESDLPKLVNLINNLRLLGFDPNNAIAYLSNIVDLEANERQLHDSIRRARDELKMNKNSMEITFKEMKENEMLLETFNQLNSMGFGLLDLLNFRDMAHEFVAAGLEPRVNSQHNKNHFAKTVLNRLRETRFLEKEIESLRKEKNMLQGEIVQQTEIFTRFMESATEKAIESIVNCKLSRQSVDTQELSDKQSEVSLTLPIVSDSKNFASAASIASEEPEKEGTEKSIHD